MCILVGVRNHLACLPSKIVMKFLLNYINTPFLNVSILVLRFGWVFQLILGVSVSLFALSQIRLKAFKYIAIILAGAFVYDVFMVFLSPYLTGGHNIMEAVVNGGKAYSGVSEDWNLIQFGLGFKEFNRVCYRNEISVNKFIYHIFLYLNYRY
jgi:hypothetical protein